MKFIEQTPVPLFPSKRNRASKHLLVQCEYLRLGKTIGSSFYTLLRFHCRYYFHHFNHLAPFLEETSGLLKYFLGQKTSFKVLWGSFLLLSELASWFDLVQRSFWTSLKSSWLLFVWNFIGIRALYSLVQLVNWSNPFTNFFQVKKCFYYLPNSFPICYVLVRVFNYDCVLSCFWTNLYCLNDTQNVKLNF